ncbi:MAG: thioredoxin family protein [Verrucomicrobiota bacterium]
MAEVRSTFRLKRGDRAPEFTLPEGGKGDTYSLEELMEGREALVVSFLCNHCPYVKHLAPYIGEIASEYSERGVQFVGINSNDFQKYPDDAPDKMQIFADDSGWKFPYLVDASQEVARAYSASCTPDFYVFNKDLELTYAGQFDGSRPGNSAPITGADLRGALERSLRGGKGEGLRMKPSSGCNIKWKPGNEPDYFGSS